MGAWKIIQPVASSNYVRNPRAGGPASFAFYVGGAVTRETTYAAYGEYSYRIIPADVNRGITLTCIALPATIHVQLVARGVTGTLAAAVGAGAFVNLEIVQNMGDGWVLYRTTANVATAGGTLLRIRNTANETWYADGVMAYAATGDREQTYLDGDTADGRWLAARHDSRSTRAATSRAGGNILDWADDLYMTIAYPQGGLTALANLVTPRPMRAGGSVDATKILSTLLVLPALLAGGTLATLHERHMAVAALLMPDAVPAATDGRPQPVRLQYWGATRVVEFVGVYDGGLEGRREGYHLRVAPSFRGAENPYWTEVINRTATLDTLETADMVLVLREQNTGAWDVLGPPVSADLDPDAALVYAVTQDNDYIYIGGRFLNFDAQAALDRLAAYERATASWVSLHGVAANAPDGGVRALLLDPAGTLWVGGEFANIGGGAAGRIAQRTAAGVWSEPGGGFNGIVYALARDVAGNIYAGGAFTVADPGGAATPCNRIAVWDGTAWAAVGEVVPGDGGGVDGSVYALAWTTRGGTLWAGGDFTEYIAYWDSKTAAGWEFLAAGNPNGAVNAIAAVAPGRIAFTGSFTTVGGNPCMRLAYYTEAPAYLHRVVFGLQRLAGGGGGYALSYNAPRNRLYIGGFFDQAGGTRLDAGMCEQEPPEPGHSRTFQAFPVSFAWAGDPTVHAISGWAAQLGYDPDIVFGTSYDDTVTYPGAATLTLEAVRGGAETKPVLHITRSGAPTTAAYIYYLRNVTTGKTLWLDEEFSDGEEIYIDLEQLLLASSYQGVVRELSPSPGSNFASWALLPGGNTLHLRTINDAACTITARVLWRQRYHSFAAGDL